MINGMTEEEAVKWAQREYYKAWRAANPDKVKKKNQNYWLRRAQKLIAERERAEHADTRD